MQRGAWMLPGSVVVGFAPQGVERGLSFSGIEGRTTRQMSSIQTPASRPRSPSAERFSRQRRGSLYEIVSATVVLADEDFAGMNEEWLQWFPFNPAARQGAKLPARIPDLTISIAAMAEP
jgi:hypothetical protein